METVHNLLGQLNYYYILKNCQHGVVCEYFKSPLNLVRYLQTCRAVDKKKNPFNLSVGVSSFNKNSEMLSEPNLSPKPRLHVQTRKLSASKFTVTQGDTISPTLNITGLNNSKLGSIHDKRVPQTPL